MIDNKRRLDAANVQLGQELWLIHSSLAIYRVIGLNAGALEAGSGFFGLVQTQSLSAIVLGFGKVYEREREGSFELASISGVYRLAKALEIEHRDAAAAFVRRYGVDSSADWTRDVDEVLARQRPMIHTHMQAIDRVRNTRLAHAQQRPSQEPLPSIAAFEDLLRFAWDFQAFINEAFLKVHSHPTLTDRQVEGSLLRVLNAIGVENPRSEFPDI